MSNIYVINSKCSKYFRSQLLSQSVSPLKTYLGIRSDLIKVNLI